MFIVATSVKVSLLHTSKAHHQLIAWLTVIFSTPQSQSCVIFLSQSCPRRCRKYQTRARRFVMA